ncbi:MAG: CehA/McbA family metallohydrolase [Pirellulales bacterium]|nr:CehA/McbA family metallohydrolase [Pirellulales bacterium]
MIRFAFTLLVVEVIAVLVMPAVATAQQVTEKSTLQINVSDLAGAPQPCRVHLANEAGQPQRASGQPFWRDHFVCSGRVAVDVPPGKYFYQIERGPEYERRAGTIRVGGQPITTLNVSLSRIANLRDRGWYSGDLHVHRPLEEIELLMRAEDLDFAPVITWWNNRNPWQETKPPAELVRRFDGHRIYHLMAGEDEREGGALLYFGLKRPLRLAGSTRESPSPMHFVSMARKQNPDVWIDIEKPFWWDVPVWLASGQMQSIGLANNHMCRSSVYASEAWGKPRDTTRLPNPLGNGFWTQEIYYHLLNSGLRVPPSAGSASGVLPNPVGYNRVYVHLKEGVDFTRQTWFEALGAGRSFVTNGPLLLVRADGMLPGHRFEIPSSGERSVKIQVELTSLDRISKVELIQNGEVTQTKDCDDEVHQRMEFRVTVEGPGWFLVRAITDVKNTFRFASTAPWFVETEHQQHRISRQSATFFLDWTRERMNRVQAAVTDPDQLRPIIAPHQAAESFWLQRVERATAP